MPPPRTRQPAQPLQRRPMRSLWTAAVVAASVPSIAMALRQPPALGAAIAPERQDTEPALFLMRNLEFVLHTWKHPLSAEGEINDWLADTRLNLSSLRAAAEQEPLEPMVIDAYRDVELLLDAYQDLLKDTIVATHVSEVARISLAPGVRIEEFAAVGASVGGIIGALKGSVVLPLVGTVAAEKVGEVGGGLLGAAAWLVLYSRDEARVAEIDERTRTTIASLVGNFQSRSRSVTTKLKTVVARDLRERHAWGSRLGFDDSMALPFERQLALRPSDAFVYCAEAVRIADRDPLLAARHFERAAALVPPRLPARSVIFDHFRTTFLLSASRAAEYAARERPEVRREALELAIRTYERALGCQGGTADQIPVDHRIAYARALASSGAGGRAKAELDALVSAYPRDPTIRYQYACVLSGLGELAPAMLQLRESFRLQPRRDVYSLQDPALAPLVVARRSEVVQLCAHPLHTGAWKSDTGLTMHFYPDGSVQQVDGSRRVAGTFEFVEPDLVRIRSPNKDVTLRFSISGDTLLLGDDDPHVFKQVGESLLGLHRIDAGSTFELTGNGTWTRTTPTGVKSGRFAIISSCRDGVDHIIKYTRDDPILGLVQHNAVLWKAGSGS